MGAYFRYQCRAIACAFQELRGFISGHAPGVIFAGLAAFLALPLIRLVPLLRQAEVNVYQEALLQILFGMVGPLILFALLFLFFWVRSGNTLYWRAQQRIGVLESNAALRASWRNIAEALEALYAEGLAFKSALEHAPSVSSELKAAISGWEQRVFEYLKGVGLYADSISFRGHPHSKHSLDPSDNSTAVGEFVSDRVFSLYYSLSSAAVKASPEGGAITSTPDTIKASS